MNLSFQQEPWSQIEADLGSIIGFHWEEIAVHKDEIKLDIDYEMYRMLENSGNLHVTTVRSDSRLVGYYVMIVRTHPHYRTTLFGFLDSYFVLPEFRKGTVGIRLFQAMEQAMKGAGVKCLLSGLKIHHNVGPIFERLGWKATETMYSKYIGSN